MHVKLSMKLIPRSSLSDHELKRCKAEARGQPWQVWEEDILWWSEDRAHWRPVDDDQWQQRRRRWLMVEAEEGTRPALLWDITEGLGIPQGSRSETAGTPDTPGVPVSDFERLLSG